MTRHKIDPLRTLTGAERDVLTQISRSASEPASHVARAKALLAVADGLNYQAAAQAAGRRAGDAVSHLVSRFNREGLAALVPRHGGGTEPIYGSAERERILKEARRTPDRERDGTATWSLTTLQRALRQAVDGCVQRQLELPTVLPHRIIIPSRGSLPQQRSYRSTAACKGCGNSISMTRSSCSH